VDGCQGQGTLEEISSGSRGSYWVALIMMMIKFKLNYSVLLVADLDLKRTHFRYLFCINTDEHEVVGSLFYDDFSVPRIYTVNDMVSE
jgi:hypothetical protein